MMPRKDTTPRPNDIHERLIALRAAENAGRGEREDAGAVGPSRPSGIGLGMRISIELITTIAVGTALGYALDVWMGTKPVAMIICLFLGAAAGVTNVYRVVKGLDDSVGLGGAIARKSETSDQGNFKERDDSRGP